MTDAERWALNAEIAEAIEPATNLPPYSPGTHGFSPKRCWWKFAYGTWHPRDFAGDMNAALDMGERLREMGLKLNYRKWVRIKLGGLGVCTEWDILQAPALVRVQAAAEVLRKRGGKE